jgi:uncharacterized repeat protein (TIGR03803 family)
MGALLIAGCAPTASDIPSLSASRLASAPHVLGARRATGVLTVLYVFDYATSGGYPYAGVTVDAAGDVFGETSSEGEVFELRPSGSSYAESNIFTPTSDTGYYPYGAPLEDSAGNLFLTFSTFGSGNNGTVTKLSPTGSGYVLAAVQAFAGSNGAYPMGGLVQVSQTLFTTASTGGKYGHGVIASLNASGLTQIFDAHDFAGSPADGANPQAGLVRDAKGVLYGTTYVGGTDNLGTVFSYDPKTSAERVLFSFDGKTGANPIGTVAVDSGGNLYGVAYQGGKYGLGTVFELAKHHERYAQKTLHSFSGPPNDGDWPQGGVVLIGNVLYGTTLIGGANNDGTIFSLSTSGADYGIAHSFQGIDGIAPVAGLTAFDGTLYGTTSEGGSPYSKGVGLVFSFAP